MGAFEAVARKVFLLILINAVVLNLGERTVKWKSVAFPWAFFHALNLILILKPFNSLVSDTTGTQ